jgi:hypothetical protein
MSPCHMYEFVVVDEDVQAAEGEGGGVGDSEGGAAVCRLLGCGLQG